MTKIGKKKRTAGLLSVSSFSVVSEHFLNLQNKRLFLLVAVSLVELVHASCCVNKLHLACIERVRSV